MEILKTLCFIVLSVVVVGVTSSEWKWSKSTRPAGWGFHTTPKPWPPHRPHGGWAIKDKPPTPPSIWKWVATHKPHPPPPPPGGWGWTPPTTTTPPPPPGGWGWTPPPPPPKGWGWTPPTTTTPPPPPPPPEGWGWTPPPPHPEIPKPTEPSVIWAKYVECKPHSKSPCSSRWVRLQ